jgi:hypothetical protein
MNAYISDCQMSLIDSIYHDDACAPILYTAYFTAVGSQFVL